MHNKILAKALKQLHKLQIDSDVFQGKDFSPENLRVLKKTGFLKPIIKGWYHLNNPANVDTETTIWYANFWKFIQKYLDSRFKNSYCLNAEASLSLYTSDTVIPKQIVVMLKKGSSSTIELPSGLSILMYSDKKNFPSTTNEIKGIQVMSLELALCKTGPQFFKSKQKEAELALSQIKDPSSLIRVLLHEDRMEAAAGRIVGAFRFLGREDDANRVKSTYETATLKYVQVVNPFEEDARQLIFSKEKSSAALRIEAMWHEYRDIVASIGNSLVPKSNINKKDIIKELNEKYKNDAYHSLSIEGYKVTIELIAKVASGDWNPKENKKDSENRNAMAARGYYEAFQSVEKTIKDIIDKDGDAVKYIQKDHHKWFESLFAPSVRVGLLEPYHLAGYRDTQVYLRGSSHVPLAQEEIADAMEMLFECMSKESNMFVCAVLGHHLFGFIHPYIDGNGRTARFIMNTFLVTAGFPWIIIRVEDRDKYMQALESASVHSDIEPFAKFIERIIR